MADHVDSPGHKTFTFVSRAAPYGTDNAQTCLELVLATAVYDQPVNYLFSGDGVYQLLRGQQPGDIDSKNLSASLQALELYGVEKIYVDRHSLEQRGLSESDLVSAVMVLDDEAFAALIRESDTVFSL